MASLDMMSSEVAWRLGVVSSGGGGMTGGGVPDLVLSVLLLLRRHSCEVAGQTEQRAAASETRPH
jgi:hypothetical protein